MSMKENIIHFNSSPLHSSVYKHSTLQALLLMWKESREEVPKCCQLASAGAV